MTFFARERGVDMFAVNVLFLVLTVPTVLLRCYVRAKIIRSFGWDDWLMIVAQVCDKGTRYVNAMVSSDKCAGTLYFIFYLVILFYLLWRWRTYSRLDQGGSPKVSDGTQYYSRCK